MEPHNHAEHSTNHHRKISKQRESIAFDPRVTGTCIITLDKDSAKKLRDLLTEWLS